MAVDSFTFEIIRHRLFRTIEEAVITLKHVSGSSPTVDGHDLLVGLYRADGSLLMGAIGYLHVLPGAGQAVKHILHEYSESPGIFEGDTFLLNDPYIGALHTPDMYVVTPVHFDGKLVGWSSNFVHLRDIGAINPGGFAPDSKEIFHEGFNTPGLKVVERGVVRKDVWRTVLNMVRMPEIVALDLHSQIAANITAKQRMIDLISKYGADKVDEVARRMLDLSEDLLKQRLRELPDGTWRARQYLDSHQGVFKVNLALTKNGDRLTYDFTGTSPQAPFGFNATYWPVVGGCIAPLFPMVCYDMDWNEGLLRPITVNAREGTIVNPIRPAPVTIATLSGLEMADNVALIAVSKMLMASEKYRQEATAVWLGAHLTITIYGRRAGRYYVSTTPENMGGSGGARTFRDGVNYGGQVINPVARIPNVEAMETSVPIMYVFRRLIPDSGGPGKFRGGLTTEFAIKPHDAENDSVNVVLYGRGSEFAQTEGLSGGYPGNNGAFWIVRNSDIEERILEGKIPSSLEELSGTKQLIMWGTHTLNRGDFVNVWLMGGGGYGDPLDRDPILVQGDVRNGLVSKASAKQIHGVVLSENFEVDVAGTEELRGRMREDRLSQAKRVIS
jgi:N-methylhydantoinase B